MKMCMVVKDVVMTLLIPAKNVMLRVANIYSYIMPVCSIVKIITPWCYGRSDALLR